MTIPTHHFNLHDGAHGSAKPLILVVDDSNVARTIIRITFQNDFEVHEASDGTQAIEMLRRGEYSYSAIMLDLVMKEVDGWAVLKFLLERHPERQGAGWGSLLDGGVPATVRPDPWVFDWHVRQRKSNQRHGHLPDGGIRPVGQQPVHHPG